ncbi:MAG: hypothetical protein K2H33_07790 [Muribaculaceae bacterium]|nr:hypothetical protein [Muribaculaceae bacterium]
MDLTPICIVAIIFGAIYKVIELLVRRKERLRLIDKITELPPELVADKLSGLNGIQSLFDRDAVTDGGSSRFISLRWGCLICGVGLGMLISGIYMACNPTTNWYIRDMVVGGSVLLSGAIGLIVAFVVEYRLRIKND